MFILLIINLFLIINTVFCDNSNIVVYYIENSNNEFEFFATSYAYCPYQILINFKNTNNIISDFEFPYYTIINSFESNKYLFTIKTKYLTNTNYTIKTSIGNPLEAHPNTNYPYVFPFAHGTKQKLTQGFNGRYSHRGWLKYSLDFGLKIGTEIYAAREGIVVDVKDDSSKGGPRRKYRKYANYITIYHNDGTFSQYVHLKKDGSVVKPGDYVYQGQLIGYSGNTGRVKGPHLHFMVYKPVYMGKMTIPVNFVGEDGNFVNLKPKNYYTAFHNISNFIIDNTIVLSQDLSNNLISNYQENTEHDDDVGDVE